MALTGTALAERALELVGGRVEIEDDQSPAVEATTVRQMATRNAAWVASLGFGLAETGRPPALAEVKRVIRP